MEAQIRGHSLTRPATWVAVGYACEIIIRLGTNLILVRLLAPELFGLMSIANAIMMGFYLMTDFGVGQALIQNKDGENKEFVDTAWTLQFFRSVFISVLAIILAIPIAEFYNIAEFTRIMPVMAIAIFISGLQSSFIMVASRKLWLGRMTALKILCQFISSIIIILWAWVSPSVWAFIAGYVANALMFSVSSHLLYANWKSRFKWNTEKALEIFKFGKWMFFASLLVFLAGQLDRLALGKLAPLEEVGVYGIAIIWAMIPVQASQTWFSRLVFPHASIVLREEKGDVRQLIRYRRIFILLYLFGMGIFAGIFDFGFKVLYPKNFWGAIYIFNILIVGSVFRVFDESYRVFNMAAGKPVYSTIGSAVSVLVFCVVLWPLYLKWGTHGLALAYSFSQLGALVVAVVGVCKLQLWDFKTDILAACVAAVAALTLYYFFFWASIV